jgi:hypothetical protein
MTGCETHRIAFNPVADVGLWWDRQRKNGMQDAIIRAFNEPDPWNRPHVVQWTAQSVWPEYYKQGNADVRRHLRLITEAFLLLKAEQKEA